MRNSNIIKGPYKRKIAIVTLALWTLAIFIYITYSYLGHPLVSKVYYENSFSFLNAMMEGRSIHSLEHYSKVADGLVHKLLTLIFVLSLVPIFYVALRKLAFSLSERKFFMQESSQEWLAQIEIEDSISVVRSVGFFFLIFLISVTPIFFSKYSPLLDYPFHLARVYILDNWDKSPLLQNWYDIRSFILPNVGMDVITLLLAKIMPVELAGRVFIAVVFAITLSGSIFLHRALSGRLALWPLLSSLFLFNWILLFGFLNYLLGIGLLLWAIGGWIIISAYSPWLRLFVGSILAIILFFCHLAALALFAVTIAGYELQRSCRTIRTSEWFAVRDLIIGAAIFIGPLVLFFVSSTSGSSISRIVYSQPWLLQKFVIFFLTLMSSNRLLDASMIVLLGLFLIFIKFQGKFHLAKSMYFPLVLLAATYFILPVAGFFTGAYIDTRIPIAIVFIFIGCSHLTIPDKVWRHAILYSLIIFLMARSTLLSCDWHKYDHITQEFTTAFTGMPPGSVMFVATGAPEPTVSGSRHRWHPPVLHLGSLAALQQKVFVPVIWAHPSKQPIAVTKKFMAIKEFQGNSPIGVNSPNDLPDVLKRIRMLVFNADIPVTSVFLLVIETEKIVTDVSRQAELFASGSRFKLFRLSVKSELGQEIKD